MTHARRGWESWACSEWRRLTQASSSYMYTWRKELSNMEPQILSQWSPGTGQEVSCTNKYKQCQLNVRKLFFIVTVIKHCHRLPRESAQGSGLGDTQKSSKKTFLLQYFPYLPKPTLSIPSMIAKLAKLFKNSCLTYSTELFFFTGRQTVI